ncbi:hypothetical protein [Mycobacterium paragordonae]|nr:hypothetical protein [Mycobacterium paragordonae]
MEKATMANHHETDYSDYRRAAVLTLHHRRGNTPGVLAIVDETNAEDRARELLFAVLGFHRHLITRLRSEEGLMLVSDYVHGLAVHEPINPEGMDIRRAAQILEHHGQGNHDGIGLEMTAATAEQRATHVFLQLLWIYETALPELTSRAGIAWIEAQIELLLAEEFRPGTDGQGGGSKP